MANSPRQSETPTLGIVVKVGGTDLAAENKKTGKYKVVRLEVHHEINRISTAKIFFEDGDPATQTFAASEDANVIPGKAVEIQAGFGTTATTIFKGIVIEHGIKTRSNGLGELILRCSHKAIKMTVGRKSAYYKKKKDSQIMNTVIGNSGLTGTVTATTLQHKKVVQYFTNDWDFTLSRAEANGMIVVTDGDSTVIVSPPTVSGTAVLKLTYGFDIIKFDGNIDAVSQLPKVNCLSWNFTDMALTTKDITAEPSVNSQSDATVNGKKMAAVLNVSEFKLQSTTPMPQAELAAWGKAQLLKSRLARVRGTVKSAGNAAVKPNTIIELAGLGKRFNGSAYVSGVTHELENGEWTMTTQFGLSPKWFVESYDNITGLDASGLLPGIKGLQNGKVQKIDSDPDGEYRVLVDVPMIAASGDGIWARMSNLYATGDAGTFFYPEVGDEVILGFLNNDPRFAVILGKLYNGQKAPPYTPDDQNKMKAIVTKKKMKITFDDENIIIVVETPGGNKMTFSDDDENVIIEDQNGNKVTMDSDGIKLETSDKIVLDAGGDIEISAGGKVSIEAGSSAELTASTGATVKAGTSLKLQGSTAEMKASGSLTVKAGGMGTVESSGMLTVKAGAILDLKASAMMKQGAPLIKIN
ncbi:MAG: type VI secretion system tip protein VgrG [Chitinophagales bacterium]